MGVWLGPMGSKEFYKYTGVSQFSQSGNNWEIKLLSGTNATFKFNKDPGEVDIFLVGAGAPGAGGYNIYNRENTFNYSYGGAGGNGGECKTILLAPIQKRRSYVITIGANGSDTLFDNYIALGGSSSWVGTDTDTRKQGGVGATSNGSGLNTSGVVGGTQSEAGAGQDGYFAFNENSGIKYGASGGGGGASVQRTGWKDQAAGTTQVYWGTASNKSGGTTGGGAGGTVNQGLANNGSNATNYGSGGGGGGAGINTGNTDGGTGGSGIIIIRNHRSS